MKELVKLYLYVGCLILICTTAFFHKTATAKTLEEGAGIIYGKNHAFTLAAPKKWKLDNSAGIPNNLYAVLYPQGSSWKDGTTVMYANVVSKGESYKTAEEFINFDVGQFKKNNPNIKIIDGEKIKADKREIPVKRFEGDRYGNCEAIAYIDEPKVVVVIVLSSRTQEEFRKYYPSFVDLVESYKFLTDKIIYKDVPKNGQ